NGGWAAIIARINKDGRTGSADVPLKTGGPAHFTAANPGDWASRLRIRIDDDIDPDVAAANPPDTIFNLRVKDLGTGATESFRNVSITSGHPRFITDVLKSSSQLLRGPATLAALPTKSGSPAAGASDPFDDPSSIAVTVGTHADGSAITATELYSGANMRDNKQGLYQLENADLFNLLV